MEEEYKRRLKIRPSYAKLPPSVKRVKTEDLIRKYGIRDAPDPFVNRSDTIVYRMDMAPEKCKRQDPYTGTAFIYDYISCRIGPSVADKQNNLVLHFPKIPVDVWRIKNPNDRETKSCNWYLTANMFILKDGVIWVRR